MPREDGPYSPEQLWDNLMRCGLFRIFWNDEQTRKNARKDLLTGRLNSRGITEEVQNYQDEYYLRGTDFVRIHIGINDFDTINVYD